MDGLGCDETGQVLKILGAIALLLGEKDPPLGNADQCFQYSFAPADGRDASPQANS